MRVLKYLRGHIPAVALIVLLLVAQSFCELSLPAYTSRIVDTGIQSGGIEYAAPLALTDKTMDGVRLFLSDDDAAAVSAAYTDADGVWTINDTAQLPELEGIFIRPLVMYARLSEVYRRMGEADTRELLRLSDRAGEIAQQIYEEQKEGAPCGC